MDDYSSSSSDDDDSQAYHKHDKAYRPPRASSASRGAPITIEEICKRKPYLVKRSDFLGVPLPSIVKLQYSICVAPETSSFADATKSSIMPPEKECEKMLEKLRASPSCSVFLPYGLFNLEGIGKFVYCHTMKKTKMMVQAEANWFTDLSLLERYDAAENIPEVKMLTFRDFLADHPFNKIMPLVGPVRATVEDLTSMCCNRPYVDTVMMKFIDVVNRQQTDHFVAFMNAMLTDPGGQGRVARAKCLTKFIFILHVQQTAGGDNVKPTVNIAGYNSDGGNHFTFCVMTLGESSADAWYVDTLGLEAPKGMVQCLKQFLLGFLQGSALTNVALNVSYAHYPEDEKTHVCSYNCSVYPKQSCTVLGGPAVILGVALAIFFPDELQLLNTKRSENECASLRSRITHLMPDLSSHARYLRLCAINWLTSGQVNIGNVLGDAKLKRFAKIKKPAGAKDNVETFIVMTEEHVVSPAVLSTPVGSTALRLRAATKKLRKWTPQHKKAAKSKGPSPDETVFEGLSVETSATSSQSPSGESGNVQLSLKERLKDHIRHKHRIKMKTGVTRASEEEENDGTDSSEPSQVSGGVVPWQQITEPVTFASVTPIAQPAVTAPVIQTPVAQPATAPPVMPTLITLPTSVAPIVVHQNTQLAGMTGIALTPAIHPGGVVPVTLTSISQTVGVAQPTGVVPMTLTQIPQSQQMMAVYHPGSGKNQTLVLTTLTSTEEPGIVLQKTSPIQTMAYTLPGSAGDGLSSTDTSSAKKPIVIRSDSEEEETPAPMEVQEVEITEEPPDTLMTSSVSTPSIANKETTVSKSATVSSGVKTRTGAAREEILPVKQDPIVLHQAEKKTPSSLPVSPGLKTRSAKTLVQSDKQPCQTKDSVSHAKEPQTELSAKASDTAVTNSTGNPMPTALSTPKTTVAKGSAKIVATTTAATTQKDADTPKTSTPSTTMVQGLLVKTPSGNKFIPLPGVDLQSISSSGIAALPIVSAGAPPCSNVVTMNSTGIIAQTKTTTGASAVSVSTTPTTSSSKKPNILLRSRGTSSATSQVENTGHSPQTVSVVQASADFGGFEVSSGESVSVYKLDENGQPVLLPMHALQHQPGTGSSVPQQDAESDPVHAVPAAEEHDEGIPSVDTPEDSELMSRGENVPVVTPKTTIQMSSSGKLENPGATIGLEARPNIITMSKNTGASTISTTQSTGSVTNSQGNESLPAESIDSTKSSPNSATFSAQISTNKTGKVLSMSPQLMKLLKENPRAKVTLPDGRELKVTWGKDSITATAEFATDKSAAKTAQSENAVVSTEGVGSQIEGVMKKVDSSVSLPSTENAKNRVSSVKRQISLQASAKVMVYLTQQPQLFYESASKLLVVQAELKAYPGASITKEFPCESSDVLQDVISEAEQFFNGEAGVAWVKEISENYRVIMVPKQLRSHLRSNPILMFVAPDQLVLSISIKQTKTLQKCFDCGELGFDDPNGMREVINFIKGNGIETWLLEEHDVHLAVNPDKIKEANLAEKKKKQQTIGQLLNKPVPEAVTMAPSTENENRQLTSVNLVNVPEEVNMATSTENETEEPMGENLLNTPVPVEVRNMKVKDMTHAHVAQLKKELVSMKKKPKKKYPRPVQNYPMETREEALDLLGKEPFCKVDDEANKLELHIQLNVDTNAKFTREFSCDGEDSVERVQEFLLSDECLAWIQGLHALFRTLTVPKNLRSFLSNNPLLKYTEPDKLVLMLKPRRGGPFAKEFECTELGFDDEEAMKRVNNFVSGMDVYEWLQTEHGIQTELDFEGVTCLQDLLEKPYTLRFSEPASIRLRACFKHGKVVFRSFASSAKGLKDEVAMARITAFANGPEGLEWARKNASHHDAEGRNEWIETGTLAVGLETRLFFDNFQFDTKNCLNFNKKFVECVVPSSSVLSVKKSESWGMTHRTDETYRLIPGQEVEPGSIQVTRYAICSGSTSVCRSECGALLSGLGKQSQEEQYCRACNHMLFTDDEMIACAHCGFRSGSRKSWGKVDGHLMCTACYRCYKKTNRLRSKEVIDKFNARQRKTAHKHLQCGWKVKMVLYSDDMSTWKVFKSRGNDFYHQEEAYQATKRPSQSQRDMWDQQILTAGHSSKTTMIANKIMSMGDETVSLKRIRGRLKRIKDAKGIKLKMSSGRKAIRKVAKRPTANLVPKEEILEIDESDQDNNANEDAEAADNVEYDGVEVVPETINPELETISAEALAMFAQTVDEQKIVILQDHMMCSMCIAQKINPAFTCSSADELFKHTSKVHCIKLFSCTTCWNQGALVSFESEYELTSHVTARHALSGQELKRHLAGASGSGGKGHTMSEEVLSAIDSIINADEFVTVQEQQQGQKRKAKLECVDTKRVCTEGDILGCAECNEECNARAMCCDNCHSWYHWHCISFTQDQTNGKWFCLKCLPV